MDAAQAVLVGFRQGAEARRAVSSSTIVPDRERTAQSPPDSNLPTGGPGRRPARWTGTDPPCPSALPEEWYRPHPRTEIVSLSGRYGCEVGIDRSAGRCPAR